MNLPATSKEEILEVSRKIVMKEGLFAINMRTVANECKVAVGSIYNYFPSKADLVSATIEVIWKDILHMTGGYFDFINFKDYLTWFFESIKESGKKYPEFFTVHSIIFSDDDKEKGRQIMEQYFEDLKKDFLIVLEKDVDVRPDAFNEILTPAIFIDYVFTIFISLLLDSQSDCKALLELVSSCIY
ncbi:transcriptional regulator, TetR family [Anaerosporobacter mobilis DSM 15930]|jgi:AcrR family transcriptional regulator|uniref:Transcriptional regulator, TetR family n=1 Tax=Anaerosporobacter mobilis DSM 15930 TaxID=1120996 RepID=A0A1M7KB60_9FIRM|nr:TetR/AcrR family transcriptional regulator [Anaerosporobacter mobilis]SHM62486.1 transcriptional regulator, TetR family [Anaerosporobacter mobilis DSM 15930]